MCALHAGNNESVHGGERWRQVEGARHSPAHVARQTSTASEPKASLVAWQGSPPLMQQPVGLQALPASLRI